MHCQRPDRPLGYFAIPPGIAVMTRAMFSWVPSSQARSRGCWSERAPVDGIIEDRARVPESEKLWCSHWGRDRTLRRTAWANCVREERLRGKDNSAKLCRKQLLNQKPGLRAQRGATNA
jgi:hypothetical protein